MGSLGRGWSLPEKYWRFLLALIVELPQKPASFPIFD
jgi:hypothetical protein